MRLPLRPFSDQRDQRNCMFLCISLVTSSVIICCCVLCTRLLYYAWQHAAISLDESVLMKTSAAVYFTWILFHLLLACTIVYMSVCDTKTTACVCSWIHWHLAFGIWEAMHQNREMRSIVIYLNVLDFDPFGIFAFIPHGMQYSCFIFGLLLSLICCIRSSSWRMEQMLNNLTKNHKQWT